MSGWVKLHRKTLDWEWFTDVNTSHLFTYLLLSANYEITKWRGVTILSGQLLTGRNQLSEKTGLSVQQVRTSLDKLKSTSEITIKSFTKYSIITICNWKDYQESNQQNNLESTSIITNNQPASNQQVTTSKKANNIINQEIKNHDQERKSDFLNIKGFFDKDEKALRAAKNAVPGKDVYYYFSIYDNWMMGKSIPDNPVGAFINWFKSYTKKEEF